MGLKQELATFHTCAADPLNRKQSPDNLINEFIDTPADAKFVIKCFPACSCFLNLHIGVEKNDPRLTLRQSYTILSAVGPGFH